MTILHRLYLLSGLALLAVYSCDSVPADFPTLTLQPGDFPITQIESGEVQAARGEVITSPRIGGNLKIIHLWPEGERVDIGDLLIQFDDAEFELEMRDQEGRLERAIADRDKAQAEMAQTLAELKRNIEQQEAQYRLAQLNVQRQQLSSPIDLEQAKINLAKAERSLTEAREDSTAQEVVNRVDLQKYEQEIDHRQERYNRARQDYERTRIYADQPGIVVYRKIWKRGSDQETKIAVGDQVHGGRALMDIPDLTQMQVLCLIGEMDLKRMDLGQPTFIRLEAFPGPVFHGQVSQLAPMATPQPGSPDIQVFEMRIDIAEQDIRLKPGMSAEVEVVIETVPGVLSVPLDAVFERDGKSIVYRRQGSAFSPAVVALGRRNATAVIIESGLQAGDVVALKDPTQL